MGRKRRDSGSWTFPVIILIVLFVPCSIGGNKAKSSSQTYFTMTSVSVAVPLEGLPEGKPILRATAVLEDREEVSEGNGHPLISYRLAKPSRLLRLDPDSGYLFLIPEVKGTESARGKKFRAEEATVEIVSQLAETRSAASNTSNRMDVHITMLPSSGGNSSYCEEQQSLCFWENFGFAIMENRAPTILGKFRPPFLQQLCPEYLVSYTIAGGSSDLFQVNFSSDSGWYLQTKQAFDRESSEWVTAEVECLLKHSKKGSLGHHRRSVNVTILDEDDCPPNAQITEFDININDPLLKKGDILNTGKLIVNDADTESVNFYKAEILSETDPKGLLNITLQSWEVPARKLGKNSLILNSGIVLPEENDSSLSFGRTRSSAIHVGVTIAKTIKLARPMYMTSFNLWDTTLHGEGEKSKVTINLRLIMESQDKSLKNAGGTNRRKSEESRGIDGGVPKWKGDITSAYPPILKVPASASPFTRLAQPFPTPPLDHSLLAKLSPSSSPFAITPAKGIIYMTDPALLHAKTSFNISVKWGRNNEIANLIVRVVEDYTNCSGVSRQVTCASTTVRRTCESMCGAGAAGLCSWRKSPKTVQQGIFSLEYSTCSPDLKTCPDGFCDELEERGNKICPQDCAHEVYGTVLQNEAQYNRGRGIKGAAGVCTCDDILKCACGPVVKNSREKSTTAPGNISGITNSGNQRGIYTQTLGHTTQHVSEHSGEIIGSTANVGTQFESCGESCYAAIALGIVAAFIIAFACAVYAQRRRKLAKQGGHQLSPPISSAMPVSIHPIDGPMESVAAASLGIQSQLYGQEDGSIDEMQQELPLLSLRRNQHHETPPDTKWELPRNTLELEETLGEGEFGLVFRGKLSYPNRQDQSTATEYMTVAVKTLKEDAGEMEKNALISEFKLLQNVHHTNVVRLIGACTFPKDQPFLLVIEYAELGSLRNFLRKSRLSDIDGMDLQRLPITRPSSTENVSLSDNEEASPAVITSRDILSFAWQISKGMAYLSEIKRASTGSPHDLNAFLENIMLNETKHRINLKGRRLQFRRATTKNKLVHRDLAARNVLLTSSGTCKISDFGLTRDIYEDDAYFKKSKGRVPVKWMAPESLSDHVYTTQSDVWGFGILLWELVTLGSSPYPGVPLTGLYNLLRGGYRMQKPQNCSTELYHIMLCCWRLDPRMRPTFHSLMTSLEKLLQDEVEYLQLGSLMALNLTYFNASTDDECPSSSVENTVHYCNAINEAGGTDDNHRVKEGEGNSKEAASMSEKPVEYTWLWRGKKVSKRWEDTNGGEVNTLSQGLLSEIEEIDEDTSAVDYVQEDCRKDSILQEEKTINEDSADYECPIRAPEQSQSKEKQTSSEPSLLSNDTDESN